MASGKERIRQYRESRRAQGYKNQNVWVRQDVLDRIDELVAAGHFDSRLDALSKSVERYFAEEHRNQAA